MRWPLSQDILQIDNTTMNGHAKTPNFAEKLEAFRQSDRERDALVAEVIEGYEKLKVRADLIFTLWYEED